jgi:hypothetical protein
MVEQNNTPESPYPGPAEPGSEEDVYPDTEGDPGRRQGDVGIETPDDEPVGDAEDPVPGNSV